MRALILLIAGLFFLPAAQSAEVISLRQNQQQFIQNINQQPGAFFETLDSQNNISYASLGDTIEDIDGHQIVKLQQHYKNVPVLGHQAIVRINAQGMTTRIHGYQALGIEDDIQNMETNITPEQALNIAKNTQLDRETIKFNWIYKNESIKKVIYIDSNNKSHLVYNVDYFADLAEQGQPRRPNLMIDARSGEVLSYYNSLTHAEEDAEKEKKEEKEEKEKEEKEKEEKEKEEEEEEEDTNITEATGPGGNIKTGKYHYGTDFPALPVMKLADGKCKMETENVMTIDLEHKQSRSGGSVFKFDCGENLKEEVNGAYSPLNDAHYFGITVFNMYKDWLNLSPLNTQLQLRVHYGKSFQNAFWDGKAMTFGDGGDKLYPLVALDVMAHEVSHGFTQFNSNLAYRGQSGGINESFSDIAGEAAEYYVRKTNDFIIGAEITKKLEGMRFMADPPKDGKSLDNVADFKHTAICDIFPMPDQCTDVHYSSGIFNKAFYLIATHKDWGTRKAFEVFVKANQKYWSESTNFEDGAKAVMDAASDLGYKTEAIVAAFADVGIKL